MRQVSCVTTARLLFSITAPAESTAAGELRRYADTCGHFLNRRNSLRIQQPRFLLLLGSFAVVLGSATLACSSSTGPSAVDLCANSGAGATVSATDNFAFVASSVTITVGQSVCWQNAGRLEHSVTDISTNGRRFNGDLPSGQAFVHTFGFGGSFSYRCRNHSNMTGTVVVNCRPGDLVC